MLFAVELFAKIRTDQMSIQDVERSGGPNMVVANENFKQKQKCTKLFSTVK